MGVDPVQSENGISNWNMKISAPEVQKKTKNFFSPAAWLVGAQIEGNREGVHLAR